MCGSPVSGSCQNRNYILPSWLAHFPVSSSFGEQVRGYPMSPGAGLLLKEFQDCFRSFMICDVTMLPSPKKFFETRMSIGLGGTEPMRQSILCQAQQLLTFSHQSCSA